MRPVLRIFVGEDDALEKDDLLIKQPIPSAEYVGIWLDFLKAKGAYDRNGKHWDWKHMLIFPQDDDTGEPLR